MPAKVGEYIITELGGCTCPGFRFNIGPCKHIKVLADEHGLMLDVHTTKPDVKYYAYTAMKPPSDS